MSVSKVVGKTYSAVELAERLRREGKCDLIITNIGSYWTFLKTETENEIKNDISIDDATELEQHQKKGSARYISDFQTIINFVTDDSFDFKAPVIFFDEIFSCVNKNGVLKDDFLTFLSQCRKRGIVFITTCQEWSELHITLRRYVRFQVNCKMFSFPLLNFAIVKNEINDGDTIHWSSDDNDYISERIQTNYRKGLLSVIQKYDTLETIKRTNSLVKSAR